MKLALFAASFTLCISSVHAEVIRFYHPDAQGNLIAMTDDQGHVIWRAEPAPFADYTRHPPDHPQRFLDQPQEPNGLFEIGARWYDPDFGRFMTPDPAPFTTADLARPGALNRYAYGLNNPYRYMDATGLAPPANPPRTPWWHEVGRQPGDAKISGDRVETGVRVFEPVVDPSEEVTEIGPVRTGQTTPSLGEVPMGDFDPEEPEMSTGLPLPENDPQQKQLLEAQTRLDCAYGLDSCPSEIPEVLSDLPFWGPVFSPLPGFHGLPKGILARALRALGGAADVPTAPPVPVPRTVVLEPVFGL